MAKIGVSGPWVAKYININGVVSYSDGVMLAMMTQFEASPDDSGNDNNFYANNQIVETDRGSSGSGTITESVDHFGQEGSKLILGAKERSIEIDGSPITYLAFGDGTSPDYFGHGIVIKKRKNGKDLWRAVVYRKVMFSIPADAATTQGETIEWQAEELTATYMRDDTLDRDWKYECTFNTEAEAEAFVRAVLNIQSLQALTVTSSAGAEVGFTAIAVSPALEQGHSYKYAIAAAVGLPVYDQAIDEGYTDWDGTADIRALSGNQILVVEVDADRKAKKGGIAMITTNEGG